MKRKNTIVRAYLFIVYHIFYDRVENCIFDSGRARANSVSDSE